jgi:dTMP kinase
LSSPPRVSADDGTAALASPAASSPSAFQRKVARSYEAALERLRAAGQRVVMLDGEAPVDRVAAAIWDAVAGLRG